MSIRKAYIDWNKLGPETKLENRKTYMVCTVDDDTCVPGFATWYEAGTVIDVSLADGVDVGGSPSAEERLLEALFGKSKAVVVPEDGFYVSTADYGVDGNEYNGAFRDCKEQLICLGNRQGWSGENGAVPAYWAEVPVLPDGLRLNTEPSPDGRSAAEWLRDKYDAVETALADDPLAAKIYKQVMKDRPVDEQARDFPLGKAVYAMTPFWFAKTLVDVHEVCLALAKLPDGALEAFVDGLDKLESKEAVMKATEEFFKKHDLPGKLRWLVFEYAKCLKQDFRPFYHYRNRILAAGGTYAMNTAAVLQEAQAMYKIQFWVGRCVKMEALGAPEVIRENELRMLVELVSMARLGRKMLCVSDDFDLAYGVHPDGSRSDRWCEFGDMELEMLPQVLPEGVEADEDESEDAQEEEEDARVIGVDYPYFAGVPAPNFLMRSCKYVIWDNAKHVYLRDEAGNVEQFDSFPKARLTGLNQAAAAAAKQ